MKPPTPPPTPASSPNMAHSVRRVLAAQVVLMGLLAAAVALATLLLSGPAEMAARVLAAVFGSVLGILATLVTARSVLKSSRTAMQNPGLGPYFGMLPVYSGLLLKLLVVAGGAFFGLVHLQLGPLYVVLGYITMQAGYVWEGLAPKN